MLKLKKLNKLFNKSLSPQMEINKNENDPIDLIMEEFVYTNY